MRYSVFFGVIVTYLFLIIATGYLTFLWFPGMYTLPTPPMLAALGSDPDFKADLLDDVRTSRQRTAELIKLAAHSFDVVLGALLGFLSAVAATTGLTGGPLGRSGGGASASGNAPKNSRSLFFNTEMRSKQWKMQEKTIKLQSHQQGTGSP